MFGNEHFLKQKRQFFPSWDYFLQGFKSNAGCYARIVSRITRILYLLPVLTFATSLLFTFYAYGKSTEKSSQTEVESSWSLKEFLLGKEVPSESEQVPPLAVTVVASRLPSFKTPFDYIPANVSYKSEEDLELVHPRTFQDSVKDLEGVVLYDEVGNGLDTVFSLRGFSEGSAVIVLVDGVRVNEFDGDVVNYPLLIMNDVEFIQIDRGSASPVYGSGAFAGVVHITTGLPSERPVSLFGGFEWSSFDGIRFNQGLSGTLQDKWTPLGGKWKYYFNGGRDAADGFRGNGDWRITSFDIKSSYELQDELAKISFGIKHIDDDVANPGELTHAQYYENRENPKKTNKPLDGRTFRNTIAQLGMDFKFWEKRITASLLANWRFNNIQVFTTSGTFIDFATLADPNTDKITTKSRTYDLIWQLSYEDEWAWFYNRSLIGMEYRGGDETDLRQEAFKGVVDHNLFPETDRRAKAGNVSLFWYETIRLFDRIIPHIGMRYDRYHLKSRDNLDDDNDLRTDWENTSWSTGVTLKPIKNIDVFGNYSQGFRVPTISELAPFVSGINRNLEPETTDSYEVGTRMRYKDKGLLKFSYFVIDLSDEIVFDSSSITPDTPFGRNINIGKSRRTGIELSLNAKPIQEIEVYWTYTWTKAYVRETDAGGSLVDERSLGQIPEHRYTLGGNIRPFKRLGEPLDGLRVGLYGIFTRKQHPTAFESTSEATLDAVGAPGYIIKPYSVWDFILSYEWREKEIYFKINNIFDEEYYSRAISATSFGTSIYPFGTYTFVNPGAPREFILGMKWEF
jgi:outer membrane receptor protein involved in Fe transport